MPLCLMLLQKVPKTQAAIINTKFTFNDPAAELEAYIKKICYFILHVDTT